MKPAPTQPGRLRILVLGYVVRRPFGGQAWHYLQYLLGLRQLGHEVYYLEDSGPQPDCLDPFHERYGADPSAGLAFLDRTLTAMGLPQHWAYYDQPRDSWNGPCAGGIAGLCRSADLLLNVSGLNPLRSWLLDVPHRCLIDTDPVFTQLRHLTCQPTDDWSILWHPDRVRQHTAFFSFGENIGRPNCSVPDDGIRWLPTRQPVVLDAWPVTPPPPVRKFTTVMSWKTYRARDHQGVRYGIKQDSLRRVIALPRQTGPVLEMVVHGRHCPQAELERHGWQVREPGPQVSDPWDYQRYIQQSAAEFSVAKEGYVVTRSGWFSERSACYLASGRPVIVQDTGFTDWLKAGRGVVPFAGQADAAAAVREVQDNYPAHGAAARAVAEEYFDARVVLAHLLERALAPGAPSPERAAQEERRSQ